MRREIMSRAQRLQNNELGFRVIGLADAVEQAVGTRLDDGARMRLGQGRRYSRCFIFARAWEWPRQCQPLWQIC
jgi:hypothetical protein